MPLGEPLEVGPDTTTKSIRYAEYFQESETTKGLVDTKQGCCRAAKSILYLVRPE